MRLEDIVNDGEHAKEAAKFEEQEKAYRKTLANKKILIYCTPRVNEKEEYALRVIGMNINSMSFWLRDNDKAE